MLWNWASCQILERFSRQAQRGFLPKALMENYAFKYSRVSLYIQTRTNTNTAVLWTMYYVLSRLARASLESAECKRFLNICGKMSVLCAENYVTVNKNNRLLFLNMNDAFWLSKQNLRQVTILSILMSTFFISRNEKVEPRMTVVKNTNQNNTLKVCQISMKWVRWEAMQMCV